MNGLPTPYLISVMLTWETLLLFCISVLGSVQQLANGAGLPYSAFADFHSVNILVKEKKILFMASIIECRVGEVNVFVWRHTAFLSCRHIRCRLVRENRKQQHLATLSDDFCISVPFVTVFRLPVSMVQILKTVVFNNVKFLETQQSALNKQGKAISNQLSSAHHDLLKKHFILFLKFHNSFYCLILNMCQSPSRTSMLGSKLR